jgi:hypothetical protein
MPLPTLDHHLPAVHKLLTTWKSTVAAVEATRMDGTALAKAVAVTRPEDPVDVTRCATRNT